MAVRRVWSTPSASGSKCCRSIPVRAGRWSQRTWISRIALAGRGIQIQPDPPPTPSPSEHRKLLRDALRLTLWRVTGSAGACLMPQIVARKRADSGV